MPEDGSEDPLGPLVQKTPIILVKPPGERAVPSENAPVSGVPVFEQPVMLMKAGTMEGKPGTPSEGAAQPSGPGPSTTTHPARIPEPKQRNGRFCVEQHCEPT